MEITDRDIFLGNATIISGGFVFMTLTGLFNPNASESIFAERLVLVIIGIFSVSSILFALNFRPKIARIVSILGYFMLLVFLHNFIFWRHEAVLNPKVTLAPRSGMKMRVSKR